MRTNTLKYVIALAIFTIAGIFAVQFIFLRSRFSLTERQFHESVSIALKEVAWQILEYNKNAFGKTAEFENLNPVERISNNYYIVNVNDVIDGEVLKFHLTEQFRLHEINTDFEFAVYDCVNDSMIYGAYICAFSDSCRQVRNFNLPKTDKYTYYFGVHFPKMTQYFNSRLSGWYVFTILLVIVVTFFGYAVTVILKQRQLTEVQKNFINNLTHELKTPISSIALAADVISDKKIIETPERLFRYAKIISEQNNRLLNNVERVLSLASLEKNKIQLNHEKLNLPALLEEITANFRLAQNNPTAKISIDNNAGEIFLVADKFHFTQVVTNIIENGIKYNTSEEPEMAVSIDQDKRNLIVAFADNGIGIPRNARKKIFRKFYRVPTGNIHNVKGFGLGLDYVAKIINAHKWKITVEANLNGGSIFKILIPEKSYGK